MFHYFYFNDMLPFEAVCKQRPDIPQVPLKRCYDFWQEDVERRLNIFYTAQYVAHHDREPFGRDIEKHEEALNQWRRHYEFLRDIDARLVKRSDVLGELIAEIRGEKIALDALNDVFDGMWFNYLIDRYPRNVIELRALPYKDYLDTRYWKYVRALMMMIYGARCQSPGDLIGNSYWMGWESSLHVHHLHYMNRGSERFEDLTLLCHRCHALVHGVSA